MELNKITFNNTGYDPNRKYSVGNGSGAYYNVIIPEDTSSNFK